MHTTQGVIVVRMLTAQAPCTTYSFRFLAQRGYFNGTHCHRLTVNVIYVLQCGDPTGTGSGAPGYRFNDENLAGATYAEGTVAMANAGPNTNGSQFFFCWKNSSKIPAGLHAVRDGDRGHEGAGEDRGRRRRQPERPR